MRAGRIVVSVPITMDQTVRRRVRDWMRSTGITQTELAARIGRNQAWLSRYLSGEFHADLETLDKIARAFGHPVVALLSFPTDPNEARLLDSFRALRVSDRILAVELLASWSQPRRPGRGRKRE